MDVVTFVIEEIRTREILDSRGNPTVEVGVFTKDGFKKAVEIRYGDKRRYGTKTVLKAVEILNTVIKKEIIENSKAFYIHQTKYKKEV